MTSDNDKSVNDLTKRAEELAEGMENLKFIPDTSVRLWVRNEVKQALLQMEKEAIERCANVTGVKAERILKAIRALNDKDK